MQIISSRSSPGAQAGPRQLEAMGPVRRAVETPFNLIMDARR